MKKSYEDTVKELSLMLIYLTRRQDNNGFCRYREISWKGYDFDTLEELEDEKLLCQPRNRTGYEKYLYLTENGRNKAKELLERYEFSDKPMLERFEFRTINTSDIDRVVNIEQVCFPPNEACSEQHMRERIEAASDLFLVAIDKDNGKVAGFLNGIATNEYMFRDEFFTDASLHQTDGKNIMLLGLDVLPEYRKQGLAHEIVYRYLRRESEHGRKTVTLTCLKNKIKFYKKMGFTNRGLSGSTWGCEKWYEMTYLLNS